MFYLLTESLDAEDIKPLFPGDTPPHSAMDVSDVMNSPDKEPYDIPGLSNVTQPTTGRGSRGSRNPRMRIGMIKACLIHSI